MNPETIRQASEDLQVLEQFVAVYCEDHHAPEERHPWRPPRVAAEAFEDPRPALCTSCARLLGYSLGRRLLCTYDPKPACKACPTPCYRDSHRQEMGRVMRYSGWRLILRGHWRLIWKYFF